jgi:multidrug efflux system membrane fusion protein
MSRWKSALLVVVVIVLAVLGWRLFANKPGDGPARGAGQEQAAAPVPVTVVEATTRDVPVHLDALGTVQALNTVTIAAQVGGQLKALHFEEGAAIAKGDLIAEIDPRTYQAALDQAIANRKQHVAQVSASKSTLKRYEELSAKNFVSAQDLENQRQTVRQQEAQIAADDAAISSARTSLGYTRITAPISGIAGIRQVDVGNLVQANASTIVVLTQVQPINVMFTLPSQDLETVRKARTEGTLPVVALDRTDSHAVASDTRSVSERPTRRRSATRCFTATPPRPSGGLPPARREVRHGPGPSGRRASWRGRHARVRADPRTSGRVPCLPGVAAYCKRRQTTVCVSCAR